MATKKKRKHIPKPDIYEAWIMNKYGGQEVTSPITGERLVVEGMGDLCWDNLNTEEKDLAVANGWGWGVSRWVHGERIYRGVLYRPTVRNWLTDRGRYLALWGGFDTGKTYAACLAATQMAVVFPGSVTVIYRDTYPQLLQTILVTLERKLWQDLGFKEGTDYRHRPGDKYRYYIIRPNSDRPSYIYYRSMPEAGVGLQKMIASEKSFEPDRIIIEESALLNEDFFWVVSRRIDRGDKTIPAWARKFLILGNPPVQGNWMYDMFRDKVYSSAQTEAGDPLPDPHNYNQYITTAYDNRSGVKKEELEALEYLPLNLRKVFLLGQAGAELEGTPVFRKQWNDEVHASYEPLKFNPNLPLLRGWDLDATGLSMACVICQIDRRGTFRVLRERIRERVSVGAFVDDVLDICRRDFRVNKDVKTVDVGDPAITTKANTQKEGPRISPKDIMEDKKVFPHLGEKFLPGRLNVMDKLLTELVDGGNPRFLLDVKGCPILHEGFKERYIYEKSKKGVMAEPRKDEFAHPQDCLQYLASHMYEFPKDPDRDKRIEKELQLHQKRFEGPEQPEQNYKFG